MKLLTHTVKNFISQCATHAIVWAIEVPFPMSKAIKKDDYQKIEKIAKNTKDYNFLMYIDEAAKHGNPTALKILLEIFERRFAHIFKSYKTNAPLLYAIENGHTECALMLLDESETDYKYKAFDAALKNQMDAFLVPFINQIPARSTRWSHVLNKLANASNEDLTILALKHCKNHDVYTQLDSHSREYIDQIVARTQKNVIQNTLTKTLKVASSKRKM